MPIQGTKPSKHNKYAFLVEIPGFASASFQKCSELKRETEIGMIREGGSLIPHKQPGLVTYSDITLERGAFADQDMYAWAEQCGDAAQGSGLVEPEYKRTIDIVQIDRARKPLVRYRLFGAFVKSHSPGDWDNETSEFVVEKLELTFDYYKRIAV